MERAKLSSELLVAKIPPHAGLPTQDLRTIGFDAVELAFEGADAARSARARKATRPSTVYRSVAVGTSVVAVASVLGLALFFQPNGSRAPVQAAHPVAPQMGAANAVSVAGEPRPQPPATAALVAASDPAPPAPVVKPAPAPAKAATVAASDRLPPAPAATPAPPPAATPSQATAQQSTTPAPAKPATAVPSASSQAAKAAPATASTPQATAANQPVTAASDPATSLASAEPLKPPAAPPPVADVSGGTPGANRPAGAADAAPAPAPPAAVTAANSALRERGDALFVTGDVGSARLFYERAAEAGDGQAALQLGETYDPAFLAQARVIGARANAAAAARWYERASELGMADAEVLLKGIATDTLHGSPQ
jgi:hypothetical protein